MPISSESMIRASLIEAKYKADEERKDEAQKKLDLFKDDYEDIIRTKIAELFHKDNYDRLRFHVNQSQNILKRVIKEISTLYRNPPSRTLSSDNKRYSEIVAETRIDSKMLKVNRYTNLLNECLVKVGFRGGRIVYDILTPNIVTVLQNDDDPTIADAIMYETNYVNSAGKASKLYHVWDVWGNAYDMDEHFRIVREIWIGDSPYKGREGQFVIPITTFHREEPDDAFFDQDTGRDLYNAAVLIGVKMTLFDYYFKTASFKQPYLIGDEVTAPAEQVADPMTIFRARGENAQIGVLDFQINLDQLQNALVYQINSVINNYGISADAWTLSIAEMSGRALRIRNRALTEAREEQIPVYADAEGDLFEKTRIVNNVHFPSRKISESASFKIDYAEMDIPDDPEEERDVWKAKLQDGLITLGQFYQHFNPDVKDEQEAEERLIENLVKLKELRAEHSDIEDMLNAILSKPKPIQPGGGEE